jgi:hypothetical protein
MTLREFAINHRLHPLNGSRKLNVPFGCEKQHIAKKTFAFFSTGKHDTDYIKYCQFFFKGLTHKNY